MSSEGRRWKLLASAVIVAVAIGGVVLATRLRSEEIPCGPGFTRAGARCCPTPSSSIDPGVCVHQPAAACPAPLTLGPRGCDSAERDVVEVPAMTVTVGPSDWEAEGRVRPRTVKVEPFAIDRLEVTVQKACDAMLMSGPPCEGRDPARAAFGISLAGARAYCRSRGGRLPTDDEWLAAAGGDRPRRYPWGDTGAVCRRAAWGLASGPCGDGANGPDTAGAHPDGVTPLGIHDLAGNVSEWVETPCPDPSAAPPDPLAPCTTHFVRGGSWKTALATELRTWLRREVASSDVEAPDPTVGFRCAYAPSAPVP